MKRWSAEMRLHRSPTATCYACHSTNGAVENTFVQFYPTLLEVATRKGTLRESYLKSASTGGAH